MLTTYGYIFLASILFSLISLVYYLLNSLRSFKSPKYSYADGDADTDDVTAVVPVYNEDEETFRKCIESLRLQASHILVVGDSSLEPYRSITHANGGSFVYQDVRRGKRGSISNAMNYVSTRYVLFVDSDTEVPEGSAYSMLSKFTEDVGGVGTAVSARITRSDNVSYCSEFFEKLKEVIFRAMSINGSVMVLDGRCAMYRTDLVKGFMLSKEYTQNMAFGKKSLLAEDRHLTGYVVRSGYKTIIDYNVTVVTAPPRNFRTLFRQTVRWSRAGYFYFFKEVADGSYFKRGLFYSFDMAYMYLFPIALISIGLVRLNLAFSRGIGNYLSFEIRHYGTLLALNFAHVSDRFLVSLWVQLLVLLGLAVFGIAIGIRITKGKKKKTLVLGIVALLMMFAASIYGLLTVWKQNEWLTR
jgi:hypothetical protein